MKNTAFLCLSYLALVMVTTGCRSILPTDHNQSKSAWETFAEAEQAFAQIIPHETTSEDLKELGFDPEHTANVKILTYLDLIHRFMPTPSITLYDLQEDVRKCIEAKDDCRAYELTLHVNNSKRVGNPFLDVFGFKKNSHITGWSYTALIITRDDLVVYKIRSGEPNIDRVENSLKPLGPFQNLEGLVRGIPLI